MSRTDEKNSTRYWFDRQTPGLSLLCADFTSMDDVRAFAGKDLEQAVVGEIARRALTRWDEHVTHHEVMVDLR